MKRYFIYLAYQGTNYCGWQSQPNAISVQETIETKLSILLRTPTPIVGAGRTDAGVHAKMMIAHFDTETVFDAETITEKLNRMLPPDISINKIVEVHPEAHARFDATSRLYRYYMTLEKDPFMYPFQYKTYGNIDLDNMNACADVLFDYIDFTSFSKLHTDVKTNNCKIIHARWEKQGNTFVFTIKADRFLRNMVRSIVGTLLEAGRGKLDIDDMRKIIETKDRQVAGVSVPGHALFLEEVEYDPQKIDLI